MKNQITIRNIVLSFTLGLFSFHTYMVEELSLKMNNPSRGIASTDCVVLEDIDSSDEECRVHYSYDAETDMFTLTIAYQENSFSQSEASSNFGIDPEAPAEEINEKLLSYISISEEGVLSFDNTVADPVEEDRPDRPERDRTAESVAVDGEEEIEDAQDSTTVVEVTPEDEEVVEVDEEEETAESETLQERFDRLAREVENRCEDGSDVQSDAQRLLDRAENRISSEVEENRNAGLAHLDDAERLIEDCQASEDGERRRDSEGEPDSIQAAINKAAQDALARDNTDLEFAEYRLEVLPLIRQHLLAGGDLDMESGSIDGTSSLDELLESNPKVAGASAIEYTAYHINKGMAYYNSLILQKQNSINNLPESEKAAALVELNAYKAELSTLDNGLDELVANANSDVARNAITFWSSHYGLEQAQQAIAQGNVSGLLDDGTTSEDAVGASPRGASVATGPGAGDIGSLDNFLNSVRQTYQASRLGINNISNVQGSARSADRLEAPALGTRVLDGAGGGVDSTRALQ